MKQVLSAIRAVAGNDDVKDAIVNVGGTDLIVLAMSRHLGSPQVKEWWWWSFWTRLEVRKLLRRNTPA